MVLTNKIALVTGGCNGIGLSYVTHLLKNNIKAVAILDLADNGVTENLIKTYGQKVNFIKCDVSQPTELENAFEQVVNLYQQLDIVINNAGILNEIDWRKMLSINLLAVIQGTTLAMEKYLPKYKIDEGIIINTASILGIEAEPSMPMYSATKHGVIGLSRCFGDEYHYKRSNIRVLTICPGLTQTLIISNLTSSVRYCDIISNVTSLPLQSSDSVGAGLIHVIKNGVSGSVWVIESDTPYEVHFASREELKKQ